MFGCSRAIAHSLVRRFEQIGISIGPQDCGDERKQRQDKTVNLQPVTVDATHLNVLYQTIKIPDNKKKNLNK